MEISPNVLRKDTLQVFGQVNAQIQAIEAEALANGVAAVEMRDQRGHFVMPPLLQAKALCLNTLVLLREKR